ncbi:tail fiber protein, partial [Enterobacter roggenkampii]
ALYDAAGTLLAVGNMAETYKPSLSEGAGRKMVIRMVIAVSEVSAITITMDTSTVMATQDYVDSELDKHAKSRNHPDATLTAKGFTQLSSSTTSTSETLAATPKAVKTVMDATNLKAPLASPSLTGTPTAPTPAQTVNNTQLATTAYVKTAVTALINSSPEGLDTLGEIAASLGNDPNFATTMLNALAAKAPLANPALTGKPTAPTALQTSNDTQLATTEFVTRAVTPAFMIRGALPANANLNSYGPTPDFIGSWSQSSVSATAADIANGYPAAERGVLEVFPGGRNNGTQRYTTDGGRFFIRWLNAAWNAASPAWADWWEVGGLSSNTVLPSSVTSLSDATAFAQNKTYVLSGSRSDLPAGINGSAVIMSIRRQGGTIAGLNQLLFTTIGTYERHGAPNAATGWTSVTWYPGGDANGWRLVGSDAMTALGLGLSMSPLSAFDWQQADFLTGSMQSFIFSSSANQPSGITYNANTTVTVETLQNRGTLIVVKVTPLTSGVGNRREYTLTISGDKGSRTFYVVSSFNNDASTVIPIANGGTGSPTAAGGLANLGGAPLVSPALTGTPKAPTAAQTDNSTQIATTAFVKAAITALINNSPAALDTLQELANALGNDANFSTTVLNALAGKQPLNAILTSLSGAVTAADRLPYFNDVNKVAVTELTAFMRGLLGKEDFATAKAHLGVGSAGGRNVGTGFSAGGSEIPDMTSFTGLKGDSGYKYLPGGVLLQWGTVALKSAPSGTTIGNFNIAFPAACHQIFVTHDNPQTDTLCFGVAGILNASQFKVNAVAINTGTFTMVPAFNLSLRWFAIGG